MRLSFGDRVLDMGRRQLLDGEREVHLGPKAFRLLELLLERRPRAVAKQAIFEAVWPGTFVGESSLSNLVAQLRAALGDDGAHPPLVRTVHGFGYAFDGVVIELSEAPESTAPAIYCELFWAGLRFPLTTGVSILGRAPDCQVRLQDEQMSRRHASVRVEVDGATLEDLGSRNGTFHQGVRIAAAVRLADGDRIRVGSSELVVRLVSAKASTVTNVGSKS